MYGMKISSYLFGSYHIFLFFSVCSLPSLLSAIATGLHLIISRSILLESYSKRFILSVRNGGGINLPFRRMGVGTEKLHRD